MPPGSDGVHFPNIRPNVDAAGSHHESTIIDTLAISSGKKCKLVMTPMRYHTTPLTRSFSLSRISTLNILSKKRSNVGELSRSRSAEATTRKMLNSVRIITSTLTFILYKYSTTNPVIQWNSLRGTSHSYTRFAYIDPPVLSFRSSAGTGFKSSRCKFSL